MKIESIIVLLIVMACNSPEEYPALLAPLLSPSDSIQAVGLDEHDDNFYKMDTLLKRVFLTEEGHQVQLRGSRSGHIYRIDVTTSAGELRTFQTAEYAYPASHTTIKWINDDYIFLYIGGGTGVWYGRALSLNDQRGMIDYWQYAYADSTSNTIIHLCEDRSETCITDMDSNDCSALGLDFCLPSNHILENITSVMPLNSGRLQITYLDSACQTQRLVMEL